MNKYGMHVSSGGRNGFKDVLRAGADAGTPWALITSLDQNILPDVLEVTPSTVTIFRTQPMGLDFPDSYQQDPVGSGSLWMHMCVPKWDLNKGFKYYAPVNEVNPPTLAAWKAFGLFSLTMLDIAEDRGLKLCLGNIAPGNPDDEGDSTLEQKIEAMGLPFWKRLVAGGHVWGVHEFMNPANAGSEALRYKRTQAYLAGLGVKGVKFAVTEAYPEFEDDPAMNNLRWYNSQLMADPYMIGMSIYQVGGDENIQPLFGKLTDLIVSTADDVPAEPPPDEPPPDERDALIKQLQEQLAAALVANDLLTDNLRGLTDLNLGLTHRIERMQELARQIEVLLNQLIES